MGLKTMRRSLAFPLVLTSYKLLEIERPSFAMVVGMQLDVFTPLKDGPLSVEHLATALAVPPRNLALQEQSPSCRARDDPKCSWRARLQTREAV